MVWFHFGGGGGKKGGGDDGGMTGELTGLGLGLGG